MEEIGNGPVALDSSVFIYFIELHPRYAPILWPLFERIAASELRAATSALTLLETLVIPYRTGNVVLTQRYEMILLYSPSLTLVPVDFEVLRSAAEIRAFTFVRTPDALQLASAVAALCTTIVTNDHRMPSLPGLEVLQLDDFTLA